VSFPLKNREAAETSPRKSACLVLVGLSIKPGWIIMQEAGWYRVSVFALVPEWTGVFVFPVLSQKSALQPVPFTVQATKKYNNSLEIFE
jgi:hypothetical protein